MSKKEDYLLEKLIEIHFADPISSLKLTNDYMIMGTMMGRISLYDIPNQKIIVLSALNSENISDISYNDDENSFYVAVGDEEIKVYKTDNLGSENFQSINVYESENKHNQNCENAYLLLSNESLFRIQLAQIDDGTLAIIDTDQDFELKYFNPKDNNRNYTGKLPMTNYSVPFDFDGENFLWVEFLKSGIRRLCKANIPLITTQKEVYKKELVKNCEIKHISHAKLLPGNKIFIVHSLNICEIRMLDKDLTLLERFTHNGEEVYAFDILYEDDNDNIKVVINKEENIKTYKGNCDDQTINNYKNNEIIKVEENQVNNINLGTYYENDTFRVKSDNTSIKQNKPKGKSSGIRNILIVTLDLNGNVNLYKNKSEVTLFNLYNIRGISQDLKDKQFFSMGYAYYIKSNLNFFCISSDHGCFIIKKNDIDNNHNNN